ncbi:septation protein A [Herbaspirillum lusitanum]|uniref:Inner membrane-spanning protein YciB n=1 Tax=Herbaspirillum lusitanum TaxID=213312 RepID=A0ABW9ACU5_9BURK
MKFLFDLFPVILFFGVFKLAESHPTESLQLASDLLSNFMSSGPITAQQAPILLSTAVAIVASIAQIVYLLARRRKVDGMLWVSLAIIVVFGGATIYFRDENFIKWKPTILYWCFGLALLFSQLFMKKNLIRVMMEKQISVPDFIWPRLNVAWIIFFAFMGCLNLYIAFNYQMDTWVNFKLFGSMGLMFVFIIGQTLFLSKYMKDAE